MAAVQFPRQKIIPVFPVPPLGILFCPQFFLHGIKQLLPNNGGYSVLYPVSRKLVYSDIPLIYEHPVETAFIPTIARLGFDSTAIQVIGDVNQQISITESFEDLLDHFGLFRINLILAVGPLPVAQRHQAVYHALLGVVHHAPHDILGHIFRIELVDVHHVTESKATSGGVIEILLSI